MAEQPGQAVRGGCRPVAARGGTGGGDGSGGNSRAEETDALGGGGVGFGGEVGARFDEGEVGAEYGAVLGYVEGEAVEREVVVLALAEGERVAPAEEGAQDVRDPLVAACGGVVLPVGMMGAQAGPFVLLQGVELGPVPAEHRHGEERAGDLGEVEPLLVLATAVERLGLGGGETT
ncbi:hypothetical protein ACWD6R_39200 [Streptomyces sp. NPDC005151]